ncbi:MFS transporter [Leifsonia flava]|uniref:MFS transporter n=1 Tax=Orlajensenia leifsoniae TaxID=2561933 RepID=A0A4Y9QXF8_9MICO|nr:MFS transporter [Leifsonia flava]TFV96847.1 MFS transporter [Leifsonia flava]
MRDFRWLWTSQAASVLGEQISELAIPLLAVLVLDASAAELGLLGVARWLPFLLLALPLGVLVDRSRRRRLIVTADWSRAALTFGVVAAALLGVLSLPLLAIAVLLVGCFTVLFEVSYQSTLPGVVPVDGLATANARLQATVSAAQIGGPGFGGVLVHLLSAPFAVLAHGTMYVVSALAIGRIRVVEAKPAGDKAGFATELREGLRHVFRDRYLVANLGFSALYNPVEQWIMVLFALHAVKVLHLDPVQIGLVLSMGAVGALLAALAAGGAVRRFGAGRPLMWCAAVESLVLLLLPVVDVSWGSGLIILALGGIFAINGAGTAMSSVILVTIRQLRTPDRILGRVNASMRWITYGTIALGAAAGGIVGELLGTRAGIAIGAAAALLTVVWVALSPLPHIGDPGELAIAERISPNGTAGITSIREG